MVLIDHPPAAGVGCAECPAKAPKFASVLRHFELGVKILRRPVGGAAKGNPGTVIMYAAAGNHERWTCIAGHSPSINARSAVVKNSTKSGMERRCIVGRVHSPLRRTGQGDMKDRTLHLHQRAVVKYGQVRSRVRRSRYRAKKTTRILSIAGVFKVRLEIQLEVYVLQNGRGKWRHPANGSRLPETMEITDILCLDVSCHLEYSVCRVVPKQKSCQ